VIRNTTRPKLFADVVALFERQGKHVYTIHYADREIANEHHDPSLGIVVPASKQEAENLASSDQEVLPRAATMASLWAV